ncbi:MAG: restriction endonuclease subunit S [Dethiosulfatibacter sp.]|nr:restriction endonuclease subunit S [Dethiosulfatibacter sp.]
MNAQDLKNSILQLAIQGKLVEQREEEVTAKELLEKIETEKKQLLNEGKIKNQKALPPIKEDEIPFDIPDSWEWVRLGDITHNWGQKKPDSTFDYIDVGSIDNVNGKLSDNENLVEAKNAPSRARKLVKKGTVIYSTVRPYLLNICIINKEFKHEPIASTAFAILHPFIGFNEIYLYYVLRSPMFISYVNSTMLGVAYPAINDANLLSGLIPLPPLEEQKRIVAKIEELKPYVDKYDVAYSEVEKLNKKFPEDMQKSILQYAIQGKLVEQKEEEGTAEELYMQIQEEKKKLIKEGKIKKPNALPEITADEIPFDIPESWKWVRIENIIDYDLGGGTPSKQNPSYWNGNIPWMSVKDYVNNPNGIEDTLEKITEEGLNKSSSNLILAGNIIVCTRVGLGKIAINSVNVAINQDLRALFLSKYIDKKYFVYYYNRINVVGKGTTVKGIKREDLLNYVFPLPPLAEQKRIVEKIEGILPYTKQLVK